MGKHKKRGNNSNKGRASTDLSSSTRSENDSVVMPSGPETSGDSTTTSNDGNDMANANAPMEMEKTGLTGSGAPTLTAPARRGVEMEAALSSGVTAALGKQPIGTSPAFCSVPFALRELPAAFFGGFLD